MMSEPIREQNELGIPLRVILDLPVFSQSHVIAGENGLDRIVSSINLMDAPDITNWITSGQLLVTTCFAMKDNTDALNDLIPILAQSSTSGLCIKTKRYLEEIPSAMIATANALNFPLIELDPSVKFDTLINSVLELLLNHRTIFLQRLLDLNESLIKMIVEGVNLNKIAETMAAVVDNSILVVDSINHREAFSYAPNEPDTCTIDMNGGTNEVPNQEPLLVDKGYSALSMQNIPHHVVPLNVGLVRYGHIYVWETKHPVQNIDIMIINRLALAITLEISRENSLRDIENSYFNDFLIHLLNDQIIDEKREIMRAQKFGIDLYKSHIVTNFRIITKSKEESADDLFILHSSIVKDINYHLKNKNLDCNIVMDGSVYTLVISEDEKKITNDKIKDILIIAFKSAEINCPGIKLKGGIGRMYKGIRGISKSFGEAQNVLKVYDSQPLEEPLLTFDELGLYRLIYSKSPETEAYNYIKETIGKLLEYEQTKNTDLLNTLEKYFEYNGNLKKISDSMYTHYNTILYRIKHIQEITGLDLNKEEDRFNLELALKLYRVNPDMNNGSVKQLV